MDFEQEVLRLQRQFAELPLAAQGIGVRGANGAIRPPSPKEMGDLGLKGFDLSFLYGKEFSIPDSPLVVVIEPN